MVHSLVGKVAASGRADRREDEGADAVGPRGGRRRWHPLRFQTNISSAHNMLLPARSTATADPAGGDSQRPEVSPSCRQQFVTLSAVIGTSTITFGALGGGGVSTGGDGAGAVPVQLSVHCSSVSKRLPLPWQPPYANSWHCSAAGE